MKKVTILDYKLGNIASIVNMLNFFPNLEINVSNDPKVILHSDKLILPGVGSFGDAMIKVNNLNIIESIKQYVKKGNSILGICLGMQLLFEKSEELGIHYGLALISGKVKKISHDPKVILPNIGYYKLNYNNRSTNNLEDYWYYFIHSFQCIPDHEAHIESTINFNNKKIVSSIVKDNIRGCQFHPEKSSDGGIKFYKNFLDE
tara:strand:+ start:2438 stop:3046 length:609 start_codon:yes stop_codon:yes gene_type:complete